MFVSSDRGVGSGSQDAAAALPEPWCKADAQELSGEIGLGTPICTKMWCPRPMAVPLLAPSVVLTDAIGSRSEGAEHHVARHLCDIEAIDTYEGTDTVQALIVGRDITGYNAFVPMAPSH
jgi:hypothetical protein